MMTDEQTAIRALNTLGYLVAFSAASLGGVILLLGFGPSSRSSKVTLIGSFAVGIALAVTLAWFTFDPALRAMQLVNSPAMFAAVGVVVGLILFALRRLRKDIYGFLEIAVAIGTLFALGEKYDAQSEITVIIGFVGAIYVFVRGLTNISEQWSSSR